MQFVRRHRAFDRLSAYDPIEYSDPLQFNWSSVDPQLQPFEAFELRFNAVTTEGVLTPIPREGKN